jgi:hypothetical protein
MIHELLLSPTETGSGSHPCCVVSVTYHRPSYFHGANAGSNPAGDANSISYGRIVYSLFNYWTRNRAVTCGPSALVTCEDCAGVGCDCAQIGTPIGSLAMLTLREDAASIEDSFRHQTRMAAPDANGNKSTVVNPEAVQCRHREIGTDKSASH